MGVLKLGRGESILRLCEWTSNIAKADCEKYLDSVEHFHRVRPRWEIYAEGKFTAEVASGELRLKSLVAMLKRADEIGYRRSPDQVRFHKAFIAACLQKILGDDLAQNVVRLMKEYELDEIRNDVIICTPRRWGKTTAVAIFVAAYLLSQPNCEVSVYSTGRRASKKLLGLIYKIVVKMAGDRPGIKRVFNQETLTIVNLLGSESTVNSYPSKVEIDVTRWLCGVWVCFISCLHLQRQSRRRLRNSA